MACNAASYWSKAAYAAANSYQDIEDLLHICTACSALANASPWRPNFRKTAVYSFQARLCGSISISRFSASNASCDLPSVWRMDPRLYQAASASDALKRAIEIEPQSRAWNE